MKLKDIKNLKWLKGNPTIKVNGKNYSIQLQLDQDNQWTINFIEQTNSNESKVDKK